MSTRYVYQCFDIAPQKKSRSYSSEADYESCGFYYKSSSRQFKATIEFVDSFPSGYTTETNGDLDYKGQVINTGDNGTYFKPTSNASDLVELQWDGSTTSGTLLLRDGGDTSAEKYHRMRGRYMILKSISAANGTTLDLGGFVPFVQLSSKKSDIARAAYGTAIYIPSDLKSFEIDAIATSTFFGLRIHFSAKDSFSDSFVLHYYDNGKGTNLQKTVSRSEKYESDSTEVISGGVWYWREYAGSDNIDPQAINYPGNPRSGDTVAISVIPRTPVHGGTISYLYQYSVNGGAWTDIQTTTATSVDFTIPSNAKTIQFRVRAQDNMGFTSTTYVTGASVVVERLNAWIGVNGKARKGVELYVGVNGKARKVTAAYIGVNGKARRFL